MVENHGLKKIQHKSVTEDVIAQISNAIMTRVFRSGDRIPTENELAESLGVGRSSVREAVKVLVAMGVLEIRRPEGTYVCEGFSQPMIQPLLYSIILNSSEESKEELEQFRMLMEQTTLHLAIKNRTAAELQELEALLGIFEEKVDLEPIDMKQISEADDHFHEKIAEMAKNSLIAATGKVARGLTAPWRHEVTLQSLQLGRDEVKEAHRNVYLAVKHQSDEYLDRLPRKFYNPEPPKKTGEKSN